MVFSVARPLPASQYASAGYSTPVRWAPAAPPSVPKMVVQAAKAAPPIAVQVAKANNARRKSWPLDVEVMHSMAVQMPAPKLSWGSKGWLPIENSLFRCSFGAYDPGRMAAQYRRVQPASNLHGTGAALQVRGRVSMVTPSMCSRQNYHENLWDCFIAQDWPDKELVVFESYEHKPSAFLVQKAKEDSRLVHVAMQRKAGDDFSVGLKRNMTLHLASGEYIVNFDDDDMYAGSYVSNMVGDMKASNLDAIKLKSWFNYHVTTGECTFSDPSGWDDWCENEDDRQNILYGYGFSYAYRRSIALEHPYPDIGFAEDAPFLLKIKDVSGKVGLKTDHTGICVHIMHRANTAETLGRAVSLSRIRHLHFAKHPAFRRCVEDSVASSPWWHELVSAGPATKRKLLAVLA